MHYAAASNKLRFLCYAHYFASKDANWGVRASYYFILHENT